MYGRLYNMKLAVLKSFEDKNVIISCLPFVIGRCRSADFIIAHVNVSRNHCEIVKENGSWKVKDYSSSGTYVNAKLVGKGSSALLNNGDYIGLGPAETNLYWKFHSFDSPSKNSDDSDVESHPQILFDSSEKKCHSVDSNSIDKEVSFNKSFEDSKLNEVNQNNNAQCKVINEHSECVNKESFHSSREESYEDKSEGQETQNLTEELQLVQNAANDSEEKSCVLPKGVTAEITYKTETTAAKNFLNDFTDLMETEFQCTICSELFVTAVTLSCAHMFCKYCINQWKKKQKTCPICRKKITTETRSLVVDNYIDKVVGNLSLELKERREAIIKERSDIEPCKKRSRSKIKASRKT